MIVLNTNLKQDNADNVVMVIIMVVVEENYELIFHPEFLTDLKRLDKKEKEEILKQVDKIKGNPERFKHLHGKGNCYTVRAGNIRIVYSIDDNKIIFLVAERRKEVYEIYYKRLYSIQKKID